MDIELLISFLINIIDCYIIVLQLRLVLTWFPVVNPYRRPFSIIDILAKPYLSIFRWRILRICGLDFSPTIAVYFLQSLIDILSDIQASLP
nr:hypothetical protein [Cryptomonas borealis]